MNIETALQLSDEDLEASVNIIRDLTRTVLLFGPDETIKKLKDLLPIDNKPIVASMAVAVLEFCTEALKDTLRVANIISEEILPEEVSKMPDARVLLVGTILKKLVSAGGEPSKVFIPNSITLQMEILRRKSDE